MDITFHAATEKPRAIEAVRQALGALELPGVRVYFDEMLAKAMNMPELEAPEGLRPALQMAFGGDGTILSAAAKAAQNATPVLGVNIGRMGFLSEIEPGGVNEAVSRWLAGDYFLEKRMMLEAHLPAVDAKAHYALNDIALIKQTLSQVVYIDAFVGAEKAISCACDGMLVSTPTGSTAYALSAGGPLMMPNMRATLLQPICAHNLGVRSLLLHSDDEITLKVGESSQSAQVFCDGRAVGVLHPGEACTVQMAPFEADFVRFARLEFLSRVRQKLFS